MAKRLRSVVKDNDKLPAGYFRSKYVGTCKVCGYSFEKNEILHYVGPLIAHENCHGTTELNAALTRTEYSARTCAELRHHWQAKAKAMQGLQRRTWCGTKGVLVNCGNTPCLAGSRPDCLLCQQIVKAHAEQNGELFQLTVTFGNFNSYKEASEFRKYLLNTQEKTIEGSVNIRGSYGKPKSQHT